MIKQSSNTETCWQLIFLLAAFSLLFDMLQGAWQSQGLIGFPVAQAFKAGLLTAMLWGLKANDSRMLLLLALLAACFAFGPLLTQWRLQPPMGFSLELILISKVFAPLIALLAFTRFTCHSPELAQKSLQRLMLCFSVVLLINFAFGFAGFGYAAYSPMEQIELGSLGSSGFFVSANELSALLLILTAYQLHHYWVKYKLLYIVVAFLALFCALQLLTKTALFGVLLLVVLIPLVHLEAERRKHVALFIAGVAVVLLVSSPLWLGAMLQQLGLYQKLLWVWQEKGWFGLILSSRDLYMQQNMRVLTEHFPPWHWLLGVGQAGIALYQKKYFAESDFFDLQMFFGVLALVFALGWFGYLLRLSWQARGRAEGRVLLLINSILLLLAALAGHVLTSGLLWLPWGCWCGYVLARQQMPAACKRSRP
ncbi:O-antigen ligase family protein [Alkalimonas amylolytica]|uniref:O-antigen ligase like membrane protein n=1 Tax=Alkalimonas amylolytica TaxID=152573 RepID=A0A1H4AXZ6_ALKAM|nr:O-antigen ligase family protein [Alkalimonas amylolytica]SEA40793.1 O-antigen ligase like membrane protein [Alkalimonas amylolytica]